MPNEHPLTDRQLELLSEWLGGWEVVADLSWPLQDTTVLHLRSARREYIVKASATSHHIAREIAAHIEVLARFDRGVPRLVECSAADGILLTEYLPGVLVEGTAAEFEPQTYTDAGAMLSRLLIPGDLSDQYVATQLASIERMLPQASALVSERQLHAIEAMAAEVSAEPVPLSFTHGDYQPRNWLIGDGGLSVIDFGRAAQRHWTSELVRLGNQQFARYPHLEAAFMQGLDRQFGDLDQRMLVLETLQQSLGTVVWAHGIGDTAFEDHGRRMIDRLLDP